MGRNLLWRFIAVVAVNLLCSLSQRADVLPEASGLPLFSPLEASYAPSSVLQGAYSSLLAPEHVLFDSVNHAAVTAQIQKILERRSWFEGVLARSRFFRQVILSQITAAQMPRELFYLVLVESEFNPNAFSRSGAAGLWQFMPDSTPPQVLMDIWQDQRYDFVKAGKSALTKLLYNHSVLGAWSPALGAYNCGLNRMKKILAEKRGSDYWADEIQSVLPAETRNYVPRIIASAWVALHAGRLGFSMNWGKPVFWDTISFDSVVSLEKLSTDLDLPVSLVLLFNPEYRFEIPANNHGGFNIRLPREYADVIIRSLQ